MDNQSLSTVGDGSGVSRRGFLKGVAGFGVAFGVGGLVDGAFFYEEAFAAADPGVTTTVPLPTTTAPEQLHLTWGADPTTSVTVSWLAPGTVAQPAPTLAYSTSPITGANPGTVVTLPEPAPLDQTQLRPATATIAFADGLSGFTTYHYHVQLADLVPDTTYYYEVSDGAATPSLTGSSFTTAPAGRAKFRFSSYGDIGEPTASSSINVSGYTWAESNDRCVFVIDAVEDPGDGQGAPLFHLLNGDLCYGNLDPANTPSVWRDFGVNVARSAANRPWMPALGNHENEFGVCNQAGVPGTAPGGIGAQGAAGNYWNGPYGNGHYLSRFVLPDNGVVNHDGNHLQGNFYSFQVGTVLFISLDADDVIYQQNNNSKTGAGSTFQSGAAIPAGTLGNNREYTGALSVQASDNSLVPSGSAPNLQTPWLQQTLAAGRADSSVDMIVVFMHQCAISTAQNGNGADLGIRQAWGPLFDQYEVDLVLMGHEHNYERSYPVRGYDQGAHGTVTTAFSTFNVGDPIDTRRPSVAATIPAEVGGLQAWNTAQGTVYLVLGGGGAASTLPYATDPKDGLPQANIWTTVNGRDAVEDAPWSAARNPADAYGYAIFDVDPGNGPGNTTITYQFFQVPDVAPGGTTPLPTTPFETLVFGRAVPQATLPNPALPEFPAPALAVGGAALAAAGATAAVVRQRRRSGSAETPAEID
jgi:Purple acid Phosphatase, N-terminal domain/Calcineurin-like phosphoesterase